ncbi:NAD(P)/FAD-dependent oxidoreductase [Halomonas sp. M20]|uniref:NAD(P)/FAD-dependent oxidoreductase n=1 Tax=Halomonas sp. M20 TaxID=2763264 RepID=UPI001D0A2D5F|nr:FAD-dependent oxidoreductase [Halomonas sp. M20]
MKKVAIIGAGIIGLSTCHHLQKRGYQVTLYDDQEPGSGTSFGNAGLIANYATTPLANIDTLRQMPGNLVRRDRSISIDITYTHALAGFGYRFLNAARKSSFSANKAVLIDIIGRAIIANDALIDDVDADDYCTQNGCLQVIRSDREASKKLQAAAKDKQADGVVCQILTREEVLALEPVLNPSHLEGGVYYPDTKHLKSPETFSRCIYRHLQENHLHHIKEKVTGITQDRQGHCRVDTEAGALEYDHLVLCAGIGNNHFLTQLGITLPVVSERGYHIMLDDQAIKLNRPVGWLEHFFYASPMQEGIRLAGTTEFASPHKAANPKRFKQLEAWSRELFDAEVWVTSEWVGARHSTPDGLPVIGRLPDFNNILVAYGHGHLGLTLAGFTGDLVGTLLESNVEAVHGEALSPRRFTS